MDPNGPILMAGTLGQIGGSGRDAPSGGVCALLPVRPPAISSGANRVAILPHRSTETRVSSRNLDWTMLRPANSMRTLRARIVAISDAGTRSRTPPPTAGLPTRDVGNVAAVAAWMLTRDRHGGCGDPLTGPASIGVSRVAGAQPDALGRKICCRTVSIPRSVVSRGRAGALPMIAAAQRLCPAEEATDDMRRLPGRPATGIDAYGTRAQAGWMRATAEGMSCPKGS